METNSSEPQKPKSSPLIALLLGFAPAAILIGFFTGLDRSISRVAQNQLLWFACVVSIACCCISSALLFRRRTSAAIGGAVLDRKSTRLNSSHLVISYA